MKESGVVEVIKPPSFVEFFTNSAGEGNFKLRINRDLGDYVAKGEIKFPKFKLSKQTSEGLKNYNLNDHFSTGEDGYSFEYVSELEKVKMFMDSLSIMTSKPAGNQGQGQSPSSGITSSSTRTASLMLPYLVNTHDLDTYGEIDSGERVGVSQDMLHFWSLLKMDFHFRREDKDEPYYFLYKVEARLHLNKSLINWLFCFGVVFSFLQNYLVYSRTLGISSDSHFPIIMLIYDFEVPSLRGNDRTIVKYQSNTQLRIEILRKFHIVF